MGTKRLEDFGKHGEQSGRHTPHHDAKEHRHHLVPDEDLVIEERENDDDGLSYTTFGD